ncbi:MAG: helix-turn-helix domain-containing protein [Candidatus Nanopelagicales bacterium]
MKSHAQTDLLLADEEVLVGVEPIEALLGLPRSTVYALARQNVLPSFRIGRAVRFRVSEVKAWLAEQQNQ